MSFIQLSTSVSGFLGSELPDLFRFWHWLMAILSRLKGHALGMEGLIAVLALIGTVALFAMIDGGIARNRFIQLKCAPHTIILVQRKRDNN